MIQAALAGVICALVVVVGLLKAHYNFTCPTVVMKGLKALSHSSSAFVLPRRREIGRAHV